MSSVELTSEGMQLSHANIRRTVLRLVWPVTVENILQMAVGLVAMAMVGRLGATAIASVGLVNRLTQMIWALYTAIGTGTTVWIARSVGAGELSGARRVARSALWLSLGFIAVTVFPVWAFSHRVLTIFGPQPDLLASSAGYLRIFIWNVPFMVITMLTGSVLRGKGDTRTPMMITLGVNVLNAGLQYALIFGRAGFRPMGLNGSALAVVIAQAAGAVFSALALSRAFTPHILLGDTRRPARSGSILKIGIPAAFESVIWQVAAFILTGVIVRLGRVEIAAHQLGLQAEAISYMPAAGFTIAATAVVGQSLGARSSELAQRYIRELLRWAVAFTVFAAAILLFLPKPFLSLLTTDRAVINLAAIYLMLMGAGQSPQNIASVFNGALRGAGDTVTPMAIALIGLWLIRVPAALLLAPRMGVVGVWLAITLDLFIRFGLSLWRFLQGRWHRLPEEEERSSQIREHVTTC